MLRATQIFNTKYLYQYQGCGQEFLKEEGSREPYKKNIVFSGGQGGPWRCSETVNWRLTTATFLAFYFFLHSKLVQIDLQSQILSFKEGSHSFSGSPSGYVPGMIISAVV